MQAKPLDKKMTPIEEALIQTKAKSGQDVLNFPVRLNNHLVALGGVVGSAETAPTQQSYEVFDMLSKAARRATGEMEPDCLNRHSGLQQSGEATGGSGAQDDLAGKQAANNSSEGAVGISPET